MEAHTDNLDRRESFVFYRSFFEAIKEADEGDQVKLYNAICEYAFDGKEPEFTGLLKTAFIQFRAQIDANNRRRENGKKGAKFGVMGGAPAGNQNAKKEKQPQNNPKTTPNVNVNDNVNDNVNVNVEGEKKREIFRAPSLEEVKEFFKEKAFKSDPEHFYYHFEANGWTQSKGAKLKKWKAAAHEWEKRQAEFDAKPNRKVSTAKSNKGECVAPRNVNDQWAGIEMPTH